jgi:hypothetical protein
MDPYLEHVWPEVHASLIVYSRNQINRQLPGELRTHIEENLTVEDDQVRRSIRPDVKVSEHFGENAQPGEASGVAVAEPTFISRLPHPARHLEIVDRGGGSCSLRAATRDESSSSDGCRGLLLLLLVLLRRRGSRGGTQRSCCGGGGSLRGGGLVRCARG